MNSKISPDTIYNMAQQKIRDMETILNTDNNFLFMYGAWCEVHLLCDIIEAYYLDEYITPLRDKANDLKSRALA